MNNCISRPPTRLSAAILAAALSLAPATAARADEEYWRNLAASIRDAGAVRVVEAAGRAPFNDRPGEFTADLLGPALDWGPTRGVVVWQLGAYADNESDNAGAFGLQYHFPPSDGRMAGINAYADYYREKDYGEFWRWSAGAAFRSKWADFYANYYFPMDDARDRMVDVVDEDGEVVGRRLSRLKAAEGYDAELRLRMPFAPWLAAAAGWADWKAAAGSGEEWRGLKYGIRLRPNEGGFGENMRFAVMHDDWRPSGEKIRVELSWYVVVGRDWQFGGLSGEESARKHFRPAQRERRMFLREVN